MITHTYKQGIIKKCYDEHICKGAQKVEEETWIPSGKGEDIYELEDWD